MKFATFIHTYPATLGYIIVTKTERNLSLSFTPATADYIIATKTERILLLSFTPATASFIIATKTERNRQFLADA